METKCVKCGVKYKEWRSFFVLNHELCSNCESKEQEKTVIVVASFIISILFLIFGLRIIWAESIYNDWKCALAECRIIK